MVEQLLLSIVIPTRNRQDTAIYAVQSALKVSDSNDFEIVVHDCGDDNSLERLLNQINDPRIKYVKIAPTSMTQNWNYAICQCSGYYVSFLGDDDGVLNCLYDIAKWGFRKGYETISFSRRVFYDWPSTRADQKGNLFWNSFTTEASEFLPSIERFTEPYYFYKLPQLYYGLVKKDLFDVLSRKTNKMLDGYCPDIYAAYSIGFLTKKHLFLDVPCFIQGTSRKANSSAISIKGVGNRKHFSEFDKVISFESVLPPIDMDVFLPSLYFYDSIFRVLSNFEVPIKISVLRMEIPYSDCLMNVKYGRKKLLILKYIGIMRKGASLRRLLVLMIFTLVLRLRTLLVRSLKRAVVRDEKVSFSPQNVIEASEIYYTNNKRKIDDFVKMLDVF
ncbi:MAG: hypothetical protein A2268_15030 [Candidatus Raymondbacteria bacterium RifOxyA12_full_50_37]|nr:MAG: hypothetical protein A2268_15030 [Candidatus Raymondbacteria bacterium RifOxyA12_full_50_37]OGJ88526.1 MAG: hypothetical protein A2248_20230 [Candidatus Raymondbacteria bacterium RIFOXYA2_FULL_49_16]OGJ98987.1 MAG: hypothetical protein A2453_10950 [Candidatus Raymondbacteria bacterium RIFOXYC2_FULL_50_21]OGP41497.1 MAG: hypothetical protein A2324_05760 [Candidatus Raymondbacteria bacterium RIFOXYB2_FULL_49_35]